MSKYRLYRRRASGRFYLEDCLTRKQFSLETSDKEEAKRLLHSHNEAHANPIINRKIAIAYLSVSDPEMTQRNWQTVMDAFAQSGGPLTLMRKKSAMKDAAFDLIRHKKLIDTTGEDILKVLGLGGISTNMFLRKIHNFALDMDWLPKIVLPKKLWPKVRHQKRRAITLDEHFRIIDRERNSERRLYYDFLWETGASQGDAARLSAEAIDWRENILVIYRKKLAGQDQPPAKVRIGPRLEGIVRKLPAQGYFFPYLNSVRAGDRSTEFKQRCAGLGIQGVSLHSYRYAWAQRAKTSGYPERMAMSNLGHGSKAVHRAYSEGAEVICPSLEEWEKNGNSKIIPFLSVVEPSASTRIVEAM